MRLWIIPVSFGAEMVWRVIRSCVKLLKYVPLKARKVWISFHYFTSFSSKLLRSEFFRGEKFFFLRVRIENPGVSRNGIIHLFKKRDKIQSYVNIYIWLLKRFCSFTKLRKENVILRILHLLRRWPYMKMIELLDLKFIFLAKNRWTSWTCF